MSGSNIISEQTFNPYPILVMASNSTSTELLHAQAHVLNATLSFIRAMSLKCAVDLGIPEAVHRHSGPIPLPDLAAALSIPLSKTSSVGRLMRVLSHAGFFTMQGDGYVLTPASHLLMESGAPHERLVLDKPMILPWLCLSSWFRGEETTSFETAHGMTLWEYAGRDGEFNETFNKAMAHDSELVTARIVSECRAVFAEVTSVVDVGGGNGSVVRALAEAFPHLKCLVFDLPHVVVGLPEAERVEYEGGSMFDFIPQADAVLLKHVLHNHDDKDCVKILRKCKEVIPLKEQGGKVILVEMIVNVVKDGHSRCLETQLFYDMHMMTLAGGRERDEQEWGTIFTQAGFTSYKITPITDLICLVEIYP